jgi:two-component system, chemotaxis family, protein-glutamate methylesterase/glutaminase
MGERFEPRIRVMIVDDSASVRARLRDLIAQDPTLELVAEAADPFQAREPFRSMRPDVVVLDLEMPGMDGLSFLGKIMERHPTSVVMFSSRLDAEREAQAFALGAAAVLRKPTGQGDDTWKSVGEHLIREIRQAAERVPGMGPDSVNTPAYGHDAQRAPASHHTLQRPLPGIIAIGASTGGPEAIASMLERWPTPTPPVVIAIHMAAPFTDSFAQRMGALVSPLGVTAGMARDGEELVGNRIYLTPGDHHLRVIGSVNRPMAAVDNGPPLRHHRPCIDRLFESVAECAGPSALGLLLTGMGDDGARGLLQIRERGGQTIAQDEDSSVVFGMPQQAIRIGAASQVCGLQTIPEAVMTWIRRKLAGTPTILTGNGKHAPPHL